MKLQDVELRYNTFDIELLIIVEAFRKWRYYLVYILCSIEVFTDHLNHRYLTTKAKLNSKKVR